MKRAAISWRAVARRNGRRAAASGVLRPRDVAGLYGIDALQARGFHGEGERIGFIEFTRPNAPDDRAFWRAESLQPALNTPARSVNVDGTGGDPAALGETDLDLQYAGALAPAAELTAYVISGQGTLAAFLGRIYDALQRAAADGVRIVSVSLGTAEGLIAQAQAIRARSEGRTWTDFQGFSLAFDELIRSSGLAVFAAAGDSGAYGGLPFFRMNPQPIWPAIQPSVIAVGGTQLAHPADPGGGEQAWGGQTWLSFLPRYNGANTLGWASGGGGVSRLLPVPAYQQGLGFSGRATPDIAAFAGPLAIVDRGRTVAVWGTSAAAPIAAAVAALVHQASGRLPLHADLYAGARDVISGNNWNDELMLLLRTMAYAAQPGYDLCTGMGTPDAQRLAGG